MIFMDARNSAIFRLTKAAASDTLALSIKIFSKGRIKMTMKHQRNTPPPPRIF